MMALPTPSSPSEVLATSTANEIHAVLTALFSEAAAAVTRCLQQAGLPLTQEINRTVILRSSMTEWQTDHRTETHNILATGPAALYSAPWLTDAEISSVFNCAMLIAESASETLPFWAPFPGGLSGLVESITERRTDRPEYAHGLRGWIVRFVILPALQWHLMALSSVDQAGESDALEFADDVLQVVRDDRVHYRLFVPLAGIDVDPAEINGIAEGDLAIRPLSEVEQGHWFDQHGGASINSIMNYEPPRVALELRVAGPRSAQYLPDEGPLPRMIAALQLHGHRPAGRFGAQYTDPYWLFPGSSGIPLALPGHSGSPSMLTVDDLREVAKTARLLKGYNLSQPQSSKALALHRFTTGAARDSVTDAVLDFTIALEALLLPYDEHARRGDLGYRFRMHGAHYLAASAGDRRVIAKQLREIYDTRSRLVHGGKYPTSAELSAIRETARDFVRRGLLRAVRDGFPSAQNFNHMVLGLADS